MSTIQTSHPLLTALWHNSPDGWVLSDPTGVILDANPAYLEMNQRTREETVGAAFTSTLWHEDNEQSAAQYRQMFTTAPEAYTFETTLTSCESRRDVVVTLNFLEQGNRRVAMLACIRDITRDKQREALATRQARYQKALAQCSQILLKNPDDDAQETVLLTLALEKLRQAVNASRAYIFRNIYLPETGLCMRLLAETCADGVTPRIHVPGNQRFPWVDVPVIMRQQLESGHPFGGPVEIAFVDMPEWIHTFQQPDNILYSFQTFPVHFDDEWWGYIGFDDVESPRVWSVEETLLLRTASEIVASTLQRWQASKILEAQVQARTAKLQEANEQLVDEIAQRQQAEADLARRLEVERVLTTLSGRLLRSGQPAHLLQDTLRDLGQLVHADRVLLIHLDASSTPLSIPVIEWDAPSVDPLPEDLYEQLGALFPNLWRQVQQGKAILWNVAADTPEEQPVDHNALAAWGVKTLAVYPMVIDDVLTAVLICSNFATRDGAQANNQRILQLAANLIENLLRRESILASLEQRVADRTEDIAALFDFTMLATRAKTVHDLLEPTIAHIAHTTSCQAICVHLLSEEEGGMVIAAQSGLPASAVSGLQRIPASTELQTLLQHTKNQPILAKQSHFPSTLPQPFHLPTFQTYFGSQLRMRGRSIGFLSAYRVEQNPFTPNDVSLLIILTEQLGVLVENHRLQQQAETMAIVGERQRLARELHDSITQLLYTQTLFARSAQYALEDNDTAKLQDNLQQLEFSALAALREMRSLLFQMKPFALEDLSLWSAVAQRLSEVERRLGINAICDVSTAPDLPEEIVPDLYRVIMEALNNSLKHALAKTVWVTLSVAENTLTLTIADDGRGFEMSAMDSGMGLAFMRERVSLIDGHFDVQSAPGQGTRVTIQVPLTR